MSTVQWAQRWRRGKDIWLRDHRDAPVLDTSRYQVKPLNEGPARTFCLLHHYSGAWPAAQHRIGLIDTQDDALVGVAVFGAPTHPKVLTNPFPTLVPYRESVELSRFVLLDDVPANGETWFLARALRLIKQAGVRGVVSFADPLERRFPDGSVLKPGHVGGIYAAANMTYLGRATPRTLTMLSAPPMPGESGRGRVMVLNERTMSKIRAEDKGAAYGVALLRDFGAPAPTPGQALRDWLPAALAAAGAAKVRHPGNHRWAVTLAGNIPWGLPVLPRPAPIQPPENSGLELVDNQEMVHA